MSHKPITSPPPKPDLTLNLMGRWFDDILAGTKTEEFRLNSKFWAPRLIDRDYGRIILLRGYPAGGGIVGKTRLLRAWRGVRLIPEFTHPHFGDDPVSVIAVDLSEPI